MNKLILVIEDNLETADNIASILTLAHYNVLKAGTGRDGIAMANEKKPDIIICDIVMPGMNGFDVLKALAKTPETRRIPFVFLTGRSDNRDFRAGMNAGADDYLMKPFNGIDLLKVIETRLRKKSAGDLVSGHN
jgi:CRP/FNR family transcriptional regulator, polysaccharide utilization system transcription regulator